VAEVEEENKEDKEDKAANPGKRRSKKRIAQEGDERNRG
jgi:hypothetical protein